MIEGSIRRGIILNGTSSLAVLEERDIVYRLEPFALVQEITILYISCKTTAQDTGCT